MAPVEGGPSRVTLLLGHGVLGQFPLQRASMHAQLAGRFGDVAIAVGQHSVQVLPLDSCQRWRFCRQVARTRCETVLERRQDAISVCRFRQIMRGTEPDAFERRRNAAVTSEHDDGR